MARALRIEYPGAVHHVTSRGNERRNIFRSDADRRMFLEFLAAATQRFGWLVTTWVLMSNHFHLVIETPMENLSQGMQWLNGEYAQWFNKKYARSVRAKNPTLMRRVRVEHRWSCEATGCQGARLLIASTNIRGTLQIGSR